MKYALLIALLLLARCAGDPPAAAPSPASTPTAIVDREFRLAAGESVRVEGTDLIVRFDTVLADSRCPKRAVCVWAGNGEIRIELSRPDSKVHTGTLNTMLDPRATVYDGYTVSLVALAPYPELEAEIRPSDYVATLVVTRTK